MTARWRLQLLAEMGVGWKISAQDQMQKQAVDHLKASFGGRSGVR